MIGWFVLAISSFIVLYAIGALLICKIPVNSVISKKDKPIEIFILTNGVHTDIVVPLKKRIQRLVKGNFVSAHQIQGQLGKVSSHWLGR